MNSTSPSCVFYNVPNLDGFTSSTNNCTNSTDNSIGASSYIPFAIALTTIYLIYFVPTLIAIILLLCVCCNSFYCIYKVNTQNKKVDEEINLNIEKLNERIKILATRR